MCLEAPTSFGWVFVKEIIPGGVADVDGSISRRDRLVAVSPVSTFESLVNF